MLRATAIASFVAMLAGFAAAQALDDAGMDFALRPTQDPYADAFGESGSGADASDAAPEDQPATTGAIGLPLPGPTDGAPEGPALAGPEEPSPAVAVPESPPAAEPPSGPAASVTEEPQPGPVAPESAPEPPAQPQSPPRPVENVDSFAPTGIRLGTFVIRPAIEVGIEATDNVRGSQDEESAAGFVFAPELNIRQESSRHELQADLRGEAIFYGDQEFDERFAEARLFGRYALTSRTDVQGELAYRYRLDRYTDPNTPEGAVERPAVHDLDASAGVTQRFGRLAVTVGGDVERSTYEEVALAGGGSASREELDNTAYGATVRTTYEASAAAAPYVEAALGRREYDVERDSGGFKRSSLWGELRGGLLFDLGSKLSGDVSVGYRRENLDDEQLDDLDGITALASILWSPRRLTEVRFDFSTEVVPTSISDASGSLLYSGTLTVARQVSPRLRLEAGTGFSHERFTGIDRREDILSGFAGLAYAFNRRASLEARYVYERTDSTEFEADTDENRVGIRIRLQR